MKRALLIVFIAVLSQFSFFVKANDLGNDIQVQVSVIAEKNTFAIKNELECMAKKEAIKKYILKLNSQTPESLLASAVGEFSLFIEDTEKISEKWIQLDDTHGQLSGEYRVSLHIHKINQWLETKGFKQQGGIELVVMEECPTMGQMKIDNAFGNDLDGQHFFVQHYTTIQRNLRDVIVKKVSSYGFDVKLLEDNELYEQYKSKDGTLVGVYFDVTTNKFTNDTDLLKEVRANNPNTLVLYYRIDSLIFEESTRKIRVTVSLNIKDLGGSVTKSIGSQSWEIFSKSTGKDGVMDDMVACATTAMSSLMNSVGGGNMLNNIAMSIKNQVVVNQGPIQLIVNASAFDKKIAKRALYSLKKELLAKKISTSGNIKTSSTTLTVIVDNPEITDVDMLYNDYVFPILEKIGIELDDDKVHYQGKTIIIKP